MLTLIALGLICALMAFSIGYAFHALHHRDPPEVLPPEERPLDLTGRPR